MFELRSVQWIFRLNLPLMAGIAGKHDRNIQLCTPEETE